MEKRNTIQKQMVLNAVAALHNHPTAEEVYAYVVKQFPTISKATVYRNLSGLAEDGLLFHVRMPEGADRFDHTLENHHHITCTRCGRVYDAFAQNAEAVNAMVEKETGFTQVDHNIVFSGLCPECSKNKASHKN